MRAVMIMCAVVLAAAAPARAQEIGDWFPAFEGSAFAGTIGMADDGRFVVAWEEYGFPDFHIRARRFDASGQPQGPSFSVSNGPRWRPRSSLAVDPDGRFAVAWLRSGPAGSQITGQRFDAAGVPIGNEFVANTVTGNSQTDSALAIDVAGNMVVAWTRGLGPSSPPATGAQVFARRFDANGAPQGDEFRVHTYTGGHQIVPAVAIQEDGAFVVAWQSTEQDGSADGVFAQRYSATGVPLGGEFPVNTYTTGIQGFPCVATVGSGFVIGWVSTDAADDAGAGVFARRFDAAGSPMGPEFRIGSGPVRFSQRACAVARDGDGGFAVAWDGWGEPGYPSGFGYYPVVNVRRYGAGGTPTGQPITSMPRIWDRPLGAGLAGNASGRLAIMATDRAATWHPNTEILLLGPAWPVALAVDESPGLSNGNGVMDPGESVVVAPTWHNVAASGLPLTGQVDSFAGHGAPNNPQYLVFDAAADYGTLAGGGAGGCTDTGDCYVLGVSTPAPRPLQHMDAIFREQLDNQQSRTWTLHIGGSFDDVPRLDPFYRFTETMLHHGITAGCSSTRFCPSAAATREQMAVFLLLAKMSQRYQAPGPAQGLFDDVPVTSPFAPWIEDLFSREVVSGCDVARYCPADPVSRAQMAVMLLRTLEGPSYAPPACTMPVFTDVPCDDPFAPWINELAAREITGGCAVGRYCPSSAVTRGQMSVFLSRTFGLDLYGAASVP